MDDTIQIQADPKWLKDYFTKTIILLFVSIIMMIGGSYLLLFDFLGDYGGGFHRKDGRGAAIALGIVGSYYGFNLLNRYLQIYKIRDNFFSADSKGIRCYPTEWTLLWRDISSIKYCAMHKAIEIQLENPVYVSNLLGSKERTCFVKIYFKHLNISLSEVEGFLNRLKRLPNPNEAIEWVVK